MLWTLPGVDIYGEVRGASPSTLFVHGFGGSLTDWDHVWDQLPGGMGAIRYDLRDFGQSRAHEAARFSHSDDLLALVDAQELKTVDLVGVSMGGGIALNFALDHPERIRRIALVSPLLLAWEWSQPWLDEWQTIAGKARMGDMEEARRLWAAHPLFTTTRADPEAGALLLASIERYSGAQWVADHQRPTLPDLDRLPLLDCPILLLGGARDLPDFRLMADMIEGCVKDVQRVEFPDCGHMLTLEAPRSCAEAIAAFLRD